MKLRMISLGVTGLLMSPLAFAKPTVTLSQPTPAIPVNSVAGVRSTYTYSISNYVPQALPLSITGISSPITRIQVPNDCGNGLLAANGIFPSVCQIGIEVATQPGQGGQFISQDMLVNIGGRVPLRSSISFQLVNPTLPTLYSVTGSTGDISGAVFSQLGVVGASGQSLRYYAFNDIGGVCNISTLISTGVFNGVTIFSDTSLTIADLAGTPGNVYCAALCNNSVTSPTYPGQDSLCTNVIPVT
ncbi:hypothetical protein [Legionella sp.]|uniref:hypothetical protein n=1 Tax=Legionella sp. TaxID=459 RepID=UPI003CB7B3EC